MDLPWLTSQPILSAVISEGLFYSCAYTINDYRNPANNGKYSASATKPDANYPESPKNYLIGTYDTLAEAQNACQVDYDTYGPGLPQSIATQVPSP